MRQAAYLLASPQARSLVQRAIIDVCAYRSWFLYALHVRINHVHGVVEAETSPNRVFSDWKAYASRALHAAGEEAGDRIYWTHGGNALRILPREGRAQAIRYVLEGQGEPMEIYFADRRTPP